MATDAGGPAPTRSPARHAPGRAPRRGRGPLRRRSGRVWATALATVLATVLAVGVVGALVRDPDSAGPDSCPDGRRQLELAVAPEIAPLLAESARPSRGQAAPAELGGCLDVVVAPRAPADVAAALLAGQDAGADAWIADSSLWLQDLPRRDDRPVVSVATSPVVLGLNTATAEQLGWPAEPPDVVAALGGAGPPLRLATADPRRSATARIVIADLARQLGAGEAGRAVAARVMRAADTALPEGPQPALERLAREPGLAVPLSEQALWAWTATRGRQAAGAYLAAGAALDYPLVPLTDDPVRRADVEALERFLAGAEWSEWVRGAGFRAADGTPAARLAPGAPPAADVRAADAREVQRALDAFELLARGMRMLAVLDVSGSMAETVPGVPGRTRMELATGAAASGLALLPDTADVGFWVFSTDLAEGTDHLELVPVGPLGIRRDGGTGREALVRALGEVSYVPDGDTGLYDTTLAAVRAVRADWDPTRVNSVVLITDGRNDDDAGITLEELLTRLAEERGDRPVPVIGISYGPDGDEAALREIARATQGATYVSRDPRQISDVLQDALASRPCRPDC